MNNTDKLLRAFIEASGLEIEEVARKVTSGGCDSSGSWQRVEVIVIDYKVTKKGKGAQEFIDIIEDAQTVLPNNAVYAWDNLQKVKLFLEGLDYEKT